MENTPCSFLPNNKSQALKAVSAKFQLSYLVNWNIISFLKIIFCPSFCGSLGWSVFQ